MYLKDETIVAKVDGVTFTSFQTTKPHFVLDPVAVTGWYDGASVRRTVTTRPASWGDFTETARRGSRLISFSGTAVANDKFELHTMRDQFMSILIEGGYSEMSLKDSSGSKFARVGLEDAPSWIVLHDTFAAWKLDLYAPDPRVYGIKEYVTIGDATPSGGLNYPLDYPLDYNTPSTVTAQTIYNAGNIDAWPEFKVTGDFSDGFTITDNKNGRVTYRGLVTMNSPVTLDMLRGTATQNGTDKSILLTNRDWFGIPAKSSIRPAFIPFREGNGWCDIMYRDTWI